MSARDLNLFNIFFRFGDGFNVAKNLVPGKYGTQEEMRETILDQDSAMQLWCGARSTKTLGKKPAPQPKPETAAKQPPNPVSAPQPQSAAKPKPKPKPSATTAARA